jgi:dolichyl-diphosphooligosaccharide--protein glycosyltransferase
MERAEDALENVRPSLSLLTLLKISIMALILLIAAVIRLLPVRYGMYISEFDPYMQYYSAKHIVQSTLDQGLTGYFDWFSWNNPRSWYPNGVNMSETYYPGVPYAGATLYLFLHFLGFYTSLETVAILFPVLTGIASVFFIYQIGKILRGEVLGFFAAFFFATGPSFIIRSILGWFDTETVGMFAMIACIYFYLQAISPQRGMGRRYLHAFLAGIFGGLMASSWGSYFYLVGIISIFALVIALLGYQPRHFERVHAVVFITMLIIICASPRNGLRFLQESIAIMMYLSMIVPFITGYTGVSLRRMKAISIVVVALFLLLLSAQILPLISVPFGERIMTVINPFIKSDNPLVRSVQEHVGSGIATFFSQYPFLLPFIVYGAYLILKDLNERRIFLFLATITSLYFASSFARLSILAAPFLVLTGSYGLESLISLFYGCVEGGKKAAKHRGEGGEKRTYIFLVLVFFVLLMSYFSYSIAYRTGNVPVTIASASMPFASRFDSWIEALEWMEANIPDDAVVAAWWDYGYWITVIGGKNSLADNATMNDTRIIELANMFLSDEANGIKIMKKLGADYVLIFCTSRRLSTGGGQDYFALIQVAGTGYGEEAKFIQMANIAGLPKEAFIDLQTGHLTETFWGTFLGKLIPYTYITRSGNIDLYEHNVKYPSQPDGNSPLILVYNSPIHGDIIAEILIYKLVE